MKKLQLVLCVLLAIVVIGLTGCQQGSIDSVVKDGDGKDNQGKGNKEQIEIDLWHFDPGARQEVYQEAIARFEEKNPNVKVNELLIQNDDYKQRVVVAMSGDNAPDVFTSWGGGWLEEFVKSGKVRDLTDEDIDYDSFVDVALNNSTYDDRIYGLPLGISTYQFFYNKEIFEKYGLEVPKTYDELLDIVEVLKENDVYPIALANQPKWPGAFYLMYFADRLGGEKVFQDAYRRNGGGFDDPAYIQAGEYIQDLVDRGAFNPGFNGVPYDSGQGRQLMYSGKAAMMLITTGFVNNVRDEFPEFEEKMGVFGFPAIESGKGDPTNIAAGVSPVWSISKDTKYPELTLELIKELTSVETAQGYLNKSGTPVAIKGVEVEDEFVKIFTDMINNANSIQFPYDQTLPPELGELHKNTTYELFGKSITPEDAAKAMENKAKEILE
ncbi:extracellular solute-binding protein [Bacillus timonensis]|uniref:Extracellular solute-binding protein n=1 Tax=Bacillus timonensis TaxID=1033734 RepID=A0A4S3PWU3_9BACI|nr:extracellular solute-binding protein [Bacillus timonensis]THE13926.1 extracellular solute-binding protein [Bacillus timonensis]